MTNADDEFGKRILSPLKPTSPLDPHVAGEEKARFLHQAESLRQAVPPGSGREDALNEHGRLTGYLRKQPLPLFKGLVAIIVALIFLVGSSLTVYAAQTSLPGEGLYPIKSISEDIRLKLTHSPRARLELTLEYSHRRVTEISRMLEMGKNIPSQVSDRFQDELEGALLIAAQMDDPQMKKALEEIKDQAENQGKTFNGYISHLTEQNEPAFVRLQERLQEQIKLSAFGESDPQKFRLEIRERQHRRDEAHKSTPNNNDSATTPKKKLSTPRPSQAQDERNNGNKQPTQASDHDTGSPGQGNPDPGNGNHGPEPSRTPKP
jgi:hypothetical protein